MTDTATARPATKAVRLVKQYVPCPNGCGGTVVAGVWIDPTMQCPERGELSARPATLLTSTDR